jgi:phage terminase small subunit
MKLSLKQTLFVEQYLITRNGREAAKLAGYKGNDATLRQVAAENLAKPYIRAAIDQRLRSTILSANQVLAELSDVAFADWREFIEIITDKDGNTVDVKLRLGDKLKALELVGKYHKLFVDKLEIAQPEDLDAALERELARVAGADQEAGTSQTPSETVH